MSREDVEVLYATYRRFNDGDHDAVLEAVDRDVVLRDRTLPDYAQEVVGREAYAGYLSQLSASFGELSYEIESVRELDDRLVVKGPSKPRGCGRRRRRDPGVSFTRAGAAVRGRYRPARRSEDGRRTRARPSRPRRRRRGVPGVGRTRPERTRGPAARPR